MATSIRSQQGYKEALFPRLPRVMDIMSENDGLFGLVVTTTNNYLASTMHKGLTITTLFEVMSTSGYSKPPSLSNAGTGVYQQVWEKIDRVLDIALQGGLVSRSVVDILKDNRSGPDYSKAFANPMGNSIKRPLDTLSMKSSAEEYNQFTFDQASVLSDRCLADGLSSPHLLSRVLPVGEACVQVYWDLEQLFSDPDRY
jgi:hypothetical protein